MIKAAAKGANGRDVLIIGLSYANLDKFRAEPRDTFIKIPAKETGLSVDVVIFSGETEAHCADMLAGLITPETKVNISPRAKQ